MININIKIVILGQVNHKVNIDYIRNWHSNIYKIIDVLHKQYLDNCDNGWGYSDDKIKEYIGTPNTLTIGIISHPLESNYYMRLINDNSAVITLYQMDEIVRRYGFETEKYIIRNIYELALIYIANNNKFPKQYDNLSHHDTRGCIFDMNGCKEDIIHSLHQPIICNECKSKLSRLNLDLNLIPSAEKDLKKIKKLLSTRITEFIKEHPIYSLAITALSTMLINIISNALYKILEDKIPLFISDLLNK